MTHHESETRNAIDFDSLVDEHQQKLYRVAYRIVGNSSEAQDIVQESFLRAFQNLHRLEDPAKLGAWLYQITVNLCRSWLRRQRIRLRILESEAAFTHVPSLPPAPDEHLIQDELRERILQAIEQLPPRQREVVELFYLQGESYQSIQERLGISKGLLGWRLKQARQKLEYRLREAYQAFVPPLLWKLRWAVPFSIPVKFVLLSLLLHFGLYVSAPRVLFQFTPEQPHGIEEVSLPVALIGQGMVNLSGDGIVPQRTRRVPDPKPLPRAPRVGLPPRAVDVPTYAKASLPGMTQVSPPIRLDSEPSSVPPLSSSISRPSRTMISTSMKGSAEPLSPTSSQAKLTQTANALSTRATVAPDREALFFVESGRVFTMDLDGGNKRERSVGPTSYYAWYPQRIAISPGGTKLAFSGRAPGANGVWVHDLTQAAGSKLVVNTLVTPDQGTHTPAWSPDGKQIAFVAVSARQLDDIWLMQADGSLRENVTDDGASNTDPSWSSDGEQIAFASRRRQNEASDIYALDLATGKRTQLTRDAGRDVDSRQPAWSPDGSTIAYTRGKVGQWVDSIYLMDVDGKNKRLFAESASQPAWSPDSTQLVFVKGRGTRSEIWIGQTDGKEMRQITRDEEGQSTPQWTSINADVNLPGRPLPDETPAIVLPHSEDSRNAFLRFVDNTQLITVRQWGNASWRVEKRLLDDPNAVIPVTLGRPGDPQSRVGLVMGADTDGSDVVVMAWDPNSPTSSVYWWDEREQELVVFFGRNWSHFTLVPGGGLLSVAMGKIGMTQQKLRGTPLRTFGENAVLACYAPFIGHASTERRIVSAHTDGSICLWGDSRVNFTLEQLDRAFVHQAMIRDLVAFWSGDNLMVASCAGDGYVSLWNASSGLSPVSFRAEAVGHIAVSPNAQWLVTADEEITQLWELSTLAHVKDLPGGGMLSISADSRWLANALDSQNIGVWDLMAYGE